MKFDKNILDLIDKVKSFGPRPQGSENLKKFSLYLKKYSENYGFSCNIIEYPSKYWDFKSFSLEFDSDKLDGLVNPYSKQCDIDANFIKINSIDQLKNFAKEDLSNIVVLLYGELSKETLFPLDYPFFNIDNHKDLYQSLNANPPLALIFISHNNSNLFLFNIDEQFEIPTITISPKDGIKLLKNSNHKIKLKISADNIESTSSNIIMNKKGNSTKKIIIYTHMDTVHNSPGAHDNSSGIICLLHLIKELSTIDLNYSIELVATSGHEYTGKGEFLYFSEIVKNPSDIKYFINIDGVGHWIIPDKIAFYSFPENEKDHILKIVEPIFGNNEGEQWPMGLHYPLSFQNIPCITFSAGESIDIHHTPRDQYVHLNPSNLEKVILSLKEIIKRME